MKCKYCGNNIPDGSIYCNHCGEKQIRSKKKTEISVPKPRQLKNGDYYAQMMVKGQVEYVTAPTEREYYAKARALKEGLLALSKPGSRQTVAELIDAYTAANKNILSPSTLRGYKTVRDNRFQSVMPKLSSDVDWQKAINKEAREVSPKTVHNAWHVITAALRAGGIEPPTVNLPQVPKADRPWLDNKQIQIFLDAVKGQPCELAALLALHSLRRSEIMGMTADRISNNIIRVRGSAVFDEDNKLINKQTNKNATSARDIPVMIPRLLELMPKSGTLINCNPNTLWAQINRVCRSAGLPEVGVHGLRHSFASLAFYLHWPEQQTMAVGGWNDFNTVHRIYTHLAEQQRTEAVEKMTDFYKGS